MTNILDVIYAIGVGMGLSTHPFGCSSVCLSTCYTSMVFTHFQTNSPGDWSQTCWIHSSWCSPDLIDLMSCSAVCQPFLGPDCSTLGQSAAYGVLISIIYTCAVFKGGHHQLCLVAPGLPREQDIWCKKRETTNSKFLFLLIINRFLPLEFHIPIT